MRKALDFWVQARKTLHSPTQENGQQFWKQCAGKLPPVSLTNEHAFSPHPRTSNAPIIFLALSLTFAYHFSMFRTAFKHAFASSMSYNKCSIFLHPRFFYLLFSLNLLAFSPHIWCIHKKFQLSSLPCTIPVSLEKGTIYTHSIIVKIPSCHVAYLKISNHHLLLLPLKLLSLCLFLPVHLKACISLK